MTLEFHKRSLALLWFAAAGLMFLLMVVYTLRGTPFGEQTGTVWSWLLPNLMPTLTLMVSVLVVDARAGEPAPSNGSTFLFGLAMALSCFYLLAVFAVLVIPGNFMDSSDLMAIYKGSGLWLGPMQGLTSGALGAFFVKR